MSRFLSREAGRLAPYTPGEQPTDAQYIKLNTNESPFPPSPKVVKAISRAELLKLDLYPDPTCGTLHRAIAAYYGLKPENVLAANGSDEVLAFAFRAFCGEGKGVAYADITYGFYPVFADLYHIPVQIVPLKSDFSIAPEDYYGLNKTIVIANPNAPTGMALSRDAIEGIVKANPDSVVVVDEAYVDFGAESCVELTKIYPNLLVVQTYSKSRSMAGARLGYAIGNAELIRDLETVKFSTNPYNVNRLTLRAGVQAIAEQDYYTENCKKIMDTRAYTKEKLEKLGFTVLDSRSNFLFARKPGTDGGAIYRGLKERGVLVRHFDKDPIRDYNRITIGTQEQMDIFLTKLEELL